MEIFIINLPDQQATIPNFWFSRNDLPGNSITITLDDEYDSLDEFGVYAYGNTTATVTVSYYNEAGELQRKYTTPLSSSILGNRLYTGKVWS